MKEPRQPLSFSLDLQLDSERRFEVEVDHLTEINGYIVIDNGAAVSAAPRTFAAHCPWTNGRQLNLFSGTRHAPAYHGHRTMPLQLRGRDLVNSPFASTDTGRLTRIGERIHQQRQECGVHSHRQ